MQEKTASRYHVCDFALLSQAAYTNPFLVDVSATFTHESGEAISGVPGFYDGEDRWVVRFSPTREGVWRGRTISSNPDLAGQELIVTCLPNPNPRVHGQLGLDPAHPRRFAFADGAPFLPLGFEFDWMFAVHQARPHLFRDSIDLLVARGFNYFVTNVYAHSGFSEPGEHVYSPPRRYVFGGTNDVPDHSILNVDFFRDFDQMMALLQERGLVVHLMLHVQNKRVTWPARRSVEDDLYWRYVVARYQAYGNLVWDLGKESYYLWDETKSWDYLLDRMRLIREVDVYGHLVTAHDTRRGSAALDSPVDEAADFVSDQVHLADITRYNHEAIRRFRTRSKPYLNIEYGYEEGAEPLKTYRSSTTRPWEEVLLWTYALYLGGAYPCYYYSNTAWDLVKFHPEPPGWVRYGYLMSFLSELDYNALTPDNELVERGFCLADPGRQYLVFLPEGGDAVVDLTAAEGELQCEWMDVYTGERRPAILPAPSFSTQIPNPLPDCAAPCVLSIRRRGE